MPPAPATPLDGVCLARPCSDREMRRTRGPSTNTARVPSGLIGKAMNQRTIHYQDLGRLVFDTKAAGVLSPARQNHGGFSETRLRGNENYRIVRFW